MTTMGRRGWRVVESIGSADDQYCVDLFVDERGDYGWAHFRADPEDGGGWTLLTRSAMPFSSVGEAGAHASEAVRWFRYVPGQRSDPR